MIQVKERFLQLQIGTIELIIFVIFFFFFIRRLQTMVKITQMVAEKNKFISGPSCIQWFFIGIALQSTLQFEMLALELRYVSTKFVDYLINNPNLSSIAPIMFLLK